MVDREWASHQYSEVQSDGHHHQQEYDLEANHVRSSVFSLASFFSTAAWCHLVLGHEVGCPFWQRFGESSEKDFCPEQPAKVSLLSRSYVSNVLCSSPFGHLLRISRFLQCPAPSLEKMNQFERRCFRIIGSNNFPGLEEVLEASAKRLFKSVIAHEHHPLRELFCHRPMNLTRRTSILLPPPAKTTRFSASFIRYSSCD